LSSDLAADSVGTCGEAARIDAWAIRREAVREDPTMTLETVLTMLLYIAAGWIALLGLTSLKRWRHSRQHGDLATGLIDVSAATVGIAYLVWWPLLLAVTWMWFLPIVQRSQKE
jgi:hypothetical protein